MAIGYRHTKTYIAASFDHDRDAVEKLYEWNKDNKLSFHFVDVHSLTKPKIHLNPGIQATMLAPVF